MDNLSSNEESTPTFNSPVDWLKKIYEQRKQINKRYSMRAFARSLQINSGRLSEIFSYKRMITPQLGKKISQSLKLTETESKRFFELIAAQRQRKQNLKQMDRAYAANESYSHIDNDTLKHMSNWYNFAILCLITTSGFRNDVDWIAQKLDLSPQIVQSSIDRLVRLKLIKECDGELEIQNTSATTNRDILGIIIQKLHKQFIKKSLDSLDTTDIKERDISTAAIAVNPKDLPKAKEYLHEFRRRMSKILESSEDTTEVYALNIQLFPLTKKETLQ